MLNFEDVFTEGQYITCNDIPTLMQCTNIKYCHTIWICTVFSDIDVIHHVLNNIVDINDTEYGSNMII